jgi:hypothetical protein
MMVSHSYRSQSGTRVPRLHIPRANLKLSLLCSGWNAVVIHLLEKTLRKKLMEQTTAPNGTA